MIKKKPRGIYLFDDIKSHLPKFRIKIIFDVGANTGQSARKYLNLFPEASLYCFEPVRSTFQKLQKNLHASRKRKISTFQMALGAAEATGQMVLEGRGSDMFFLLNTSQDVSVDGGTRLESVKIETLDNFCHRLDISHIDYLKIDTEGGDLDVLIGASRMLVEHRIDLIEVEAGMNPDNKRHVPFEKLKGFLEERKYFLFGVYEQVEEWPTKAPHLRRTNPAFISGNLIKANTVKKTARVAAKRRPARRPR
jgi:FkbM family methyltransferase